MKKGLIVLLSFATLLLAWCFNSENVVSNEVEIDNWNEEQVNQAEATFNKQIEETQYIKDLEEFISHDVDLILNNKSYIWEYIIDANFDKDSSIQWWLNLSLNKYAETKDIETSDIEFALNETESWSEDPLNVTWSLSLLYQWENMYANIHNFELYMWEDNMNAKMYQLFIELLLNKWVDMEAGNWWIVSVNTEDSNLENTISNLKNILRTEDIHSELFLNSLSQLISAINWTIDLWISTKDLSIESSEEVKFYETDDWVIEKEFIASLQWSESKFDLSFLASKNWLTVHLYNIKNFDETTQNFVDSDGEVIFSIENNKKSNYNIALLITRNWYSIADIQWVINFWNTTKISAKFILQPELLGWKKVSWSFEGNITKKSPKGSEKIPEISWELIKISEVLSAL